MTTNDTHGSFDDILSEASPALRPICQSLRDLVVSLHGEFVEVVWSTQKIASFGVGPKKMTEHYCYIGVHGAHVNFGFYHGASLPDPNGLLEGTGKRLRHIKIGDVAGAKAPAVKKLLREAIADRKRTLSR